MVRDFVRATSTVSLVLALAAPAFGASVIEGRVSERNARGTVWPATYANVSLLGARLGVQANEAGRFRLSGLSAGRYPLRVAFIGARRLDTLITLAEGDTARLDLVLDDLPLANSSDRHCLPRAGLLARFRRASVVRVFRVDGRPDVPPAVADTARTLGGHWIAAAWPRSAEWLRTMRSSLSRHRSWGTKGPGEISTFPTVGLRFHDRRGYVDVVVLPRSGIVLVDEGGARPDDYFWRDMAPPLAQWLDGPTARQ